MLTSPVFDLSTYIDPEISYYRWFANAGGSGSPDDSLIITLTNGVADQVIDIVTANSSSLNQWIFSTTNISIPLTSNMQLKVYTADYSPGHLVEAAFDMFQVEELGVSHDWECIAGACIELGGNAGSFLSEADCIQLCTSSSALEIQNNSAFPNPTKSNIEYVSSYRGVVYVKDALGKILLELDKKEDVLKVKLGKFSPGVYFIETPKDKLKIVKQ